MPDPARPLQPALPARGSLLGFDFGLARIGVAVGELETGCANALLTIQEQSAKARFAIIEGLLAEWQPTALVVGIARHLDGSDSDMTQRCRRFANQLRGRFGVTVLECDERLTSVAADTALKVTGQRDWRVRKTALDAVAAQIILQQLLDDRPNEKY